MKNEVLSRSIGNKKISSITLGALADIGYAVNFTAADPYDIDDIGDCAVCPENIQVRRRLMKSPVLPSKSSCNGDAKKNAVEHGKALLQKMHESNDESKKSSTLPEGVVNAGNQRVLVTYTSEGGTLCTTSI